LLGFVLLGFVLFGFVLFGFTTKGLNKFFIARIVKRAQAGRQTTGPVAGPDSPHVQAAVAAEISAGREARVIARQPGAD
jgi:hypothetical protein